ncbi:hypothetical protein AXL65_02355 [Salmonella enterica subsp. enterica]|nr:hypothetical protein [Salmonella enterica subsp. enterica]
MIKTMLERLLGHLHRAVFDTTADKVVAFTLDGPAGSKWIAKDENFDITFADGSTKHYDLNKFTIVQFMRQLRADGMTIDNINQETLYFSGITMLELSGAAGKDNPITLYRDILHAIFGAYSREMRDAQQAVNDGINQMYIPTADDGFLDTWGKLFGVARNGDDDPKYRKKIPKEAFRKRVNSYAIEQAVKDLTGYDITLEEPWRDIFRLDESYLSGPDRLYNGQDIGYFIVQPVAFGNVDWGVIMPIIKRNLAAGVQTLQPNTELRYFVNDPLDGTIWWQNWSMYGTWVRTDEMPRLDNGLILSGGYKIQYNFDVAITSLYSTNNFLSLPLGKVFFAPAVSLAFYAERGDTPIKTWYQAFNTHLDPLYPDGVIVELIQMYPTDPRTWMIGGWDSTATWHKPYDWQVFSRQTSLEDKFFVDGTLIGHYYPSPATDEHDPAVTNPHVPSLPVLSQHTEGDTWDDHDWNDKDWDQ